MDNAWEQETLEAKKMPVSRADSHTSVARFVSLLLLTVSFQSGGPNTSDGKKNAVISRTIDSELPAFSTK